VAKDMDAAVRWYTASAQGGYPMARNDLGVMYARGEGVKTDKVLAYYWLDRAAASFAQAKVDGGAQAISNRDSVAAHMSHDELARARAMASETRPT
jgi:hypothetical protein